MFRSTIQFFYYPAKNFFLFSPHPFLFLFRNLMVISKQMKDSVCCEICDFVVEGRPPLCCLPFCGLYGNNHITEELWLNVWE